MENKEYEKGYSLQEAAELLGRSVVTVRRYVKNGTLKASMLGGKYIIPAAEVKKVSVIFMMIVRNTNMRIKYRHISMSINAGYRT